MFSLYLTLKFIHVAAVIFWIGGTTTMTIWTIRAGREREPTALAVTVRHAIFYAQRVVGPSSGVVLLAGIAMVISAKIPWGTLWIMWGLAGVLLHIILGVTVLRTNSERLAQLAGSGSPDPVKLGQVLARQKTVTAIYVLIMLSVVWAMVAKPTL
jgi:uncharacterized membrane protein